MTDWLAQLPLDPLCDFCSAHDPVVLYPCADFTFTAITEGEVWEQPSEGPWTACHDCQLLIELDEWDRLATRLFDVRGGIPEDNPQLAHDYMRTWLTEGFRDHRRGDPIPLPR